MSGDHWWLILRVPENVLVDNNLHCFKPIPTHCNSFAGNVSRMWFNIHSAWAQDLGQLAEAWWMTSIWRSNRKVVVKTMHFVFVTAITKTYEYSKWIVWRYQAITFHADSEVQRYWSRSISQEILQPTITNISFKIVHLNIQFNLTGANQLKINILPIKIAKEIYFHKKTSA